MCWAVRTCKQANGLAGDRSPCHRLPASYGCAAGYGLCRLNAAHWQHCPSACLVCESEEGCLVRHVSCSSSTTAAAAPSELSPSLSPALLRSGGMPCWASLLGAFACLPHQYGEQVRFALLCDAAQQQQLAAGKASRLHAGRATVRVALSGMLPVDCTLQQRAKLNLAVNAPGCRCHRVLNGAKYASPLLRCT